jgi:hypothetical protein
MKNLTLLLLLFCPILSQNHINEWQIKSDFYNQINHASISSYTFELSQDDTSLTVNALCEEKAFDEIDKEALINETTIEELMKLHNIETFDFKLKTDDNTKEFLFFQGMNN